MDFSFTPEQEGLRGAVRALARDMASTADLHRVAAGGDGHDPRVWHAVCADLGLAGLGVPEPRGAGGDFVDVAVVLEEAGRALLPAPMLPTLVAGSALAGSDDAGGLLDLVCSGVVASVVPASLHVEGGRLTGTVVHIVDGALARVLVLADASGLWCVSTDDPGCVVERTPTLDPLRGQAVARLRGARATRVGDPAAAERAVDLLRVALAVEAVGVARRCLDLTVEHLKTRVQFGRPIGAFQALQHRAADLVVALESATSTAYYAAWVAAAAPDELPVLAPLAKSVCLDAAFRAAAETIQMHGGIGITWEHDAHLLFKRAATSRWLLGDSHEQRRLVAARTGLAGRSS